MKNYESNGFTEFKIENRKKVNRYLNFVLWFFAIAAPAIALGVKAGFFHDISYLTCINILVIVAVLSTIHLILYKKIPTSLVTCLFALTALDALLVYMAVSHVSIYLTWFLVPLLSLLFCDRFVFLYSVIMNTALMIVTTVLTAPYHTLLRADYDNAGAYLADVLGGFAIETTVMLASGFIILKMMIYYLSRLFDQKNTIIENESEMKEKVNILESMAEIYDNVNLIDFVESTEMSLRGSEQKKYVIDMKNQTHTVMNQRIREHIVHDQLDDFLKFTNITTVRARLTNKKIISADFIDVTHGWFRAQYITVDASPDGIPNVVIYTIRNVDEDKRREEHLIRIAMTDEMTRLYNRRCYDEDLAEIRKNSLPDDFVIFSLDINGLKPVNDNKGHAAGDELIKGAADCLAVSVGNSGKSYRTGGDEFMAIAYTKDPGTVREKILKKAGEWHGVYTDELTVSVGYASVKENPDCTADGLERLADADMYAEKERFYKHRGIEKHR